MKLAYISCRTYLNALSVLHQLAAFGIETSITEGGLTINRYHGVTDEQYADIIDQIRALGISVDWGNTFAASYRDTVREDKPQ